MTVHVVPLPAAVLAEAFVVVAIIADVLTDVAVVAALVVVVTAFY